MEAVMTYAQAFFGWLLQTTMIASLVICMILLIQRILGNKLGPRWSHALWLVLLVRMILPWAPSSRVSLSNLVLAWQRQTQSQLSHGTVEVQKVSPPKQATESPETVISQELESKLVAQEQTAQEPRIVTNTETRSWPRLVLLRRILPIIWLAGAIVIGAYLLFSDLALWRIVKRDHPLVNQAMLELFEECKAQMGVQSLVVVVPSDRVRSPGLFGFVRPRLLLPRQMLDTATRQELQYVFLHELAHLRRHDIYLGWLTSLLQVLHWFNPLVWFAFYRMRADRELACDALVLTRMGQNKSQDYGGAIVELVRRFSRSRPLPAMAGIIESKSQLKRRITMITKFRNKSYCFSPLAVIVMILLACVSLPDARYSQASAFSAVEPAGVTSDAQRTGLVVREVKIKQGESGLSLSRDGKQLVYPKRKDGTKNLVVRDLASGEETEITKYETGTARYPVFSPDGKEIVYTRTQGMRNQKLHIVSLETGEDRDLDHYGFAQDWSKDGSLILFSPWQEEDKQTTYDMLSVSEGTVKELNVPISRKLMGPPRFSPDAKYISYSHQGKVYLYHVDSGDAVRITQGPAAGQALWSLDGKMLFFLSPQAFGPEADLCGLSIVDGKAVGGVQIIKPDFGDYVNLISLSDTGRLLYRQYHFEEHSYSTEVDPQTNQPLGQPVQLVDGQRAAWSPDGKRIAYISGSLHVMSADGSNDRKITQVHPFKGPYAWAPDNDHIYMVERVEDRAGIFAISISAKDTRPVFIDPDIMGHVTCSPDGKRLAFLKLPVSSGKPEIFTVNTDGTNLRQLTSDDNANVMYTAWSPDGKYIAFASKRQSEDIRALRVVSVDDGTTRDLFRGETPEDRFHWVSWSPDGSKIVWTSSDEIRIGQVSDGKYNTFRVDVGGPAKSTFHMPRLSPDGTKMLFFTWASVQHLMLMENFLPGSSVAKPTGTVVRQVWTDAADPQFLGATSPDGKYLSYVDRETGCLSVHELATGKNRQLTNERQSQGFVGNSVFSPDGRQVAYFWWSQEKGSELRIVGLDGSGPRVVNQDEEASIYSRGIYPTGWTPDGKQILALGRKGDRSLEILLVPVANGPVHVLKAIGKKLPGGRRFPGLCLSPDGRYVAYTFLPDEESMNRDISVIATDGSHEIPLEKHPADDFVLGWAPDSKRVVFASDRTGSMGIWVVDVAESKMQGTSELLKPDVGRFYPLGLTQNGSFYYGVYSGSCNVYTATYDPQKGDITSKPVIAVHRYEGSNWAPAWSPDGQHLACVSASPGSHPVFLIYSVKSGEVRKLSSDLRDFNLHSLRWSPDGRFLLGSGKTKDVFWGVLKIDVETGEVTVIVEGPGILGPNWAADSKAVFYICNLKTNGGIIRHDLATGEKKELYSAPGFISALALSPDGRQLAFHDIQGGALKVLSATGGEPRELVKVKGKITIAWTPDGRHLVYGSRGLGDGPGHLWRIPAGGGEPKTLDLEMPYLDHVRFQPDGRQVAFTGSVGKDKCEVWLMENFLPEAIAMSK